jgi:hypothetical protein
MWQAFRSDWLIRPAVALLTATSCVAGLELAARVILPEQLAEPCLTPAGTSRADCVSQMKAAEGPWTSVAFNACGSRSIHPCEALPTEERVVVIGSSVSRGFAVSYQDMFAPRAEAMLAQVCSTPVVFQNLVIRWPTEPDSAAWSNVTAAAHEALALRPKTILMFVTAWDLSQYHDESSAAASRSGWKATYVFRVLSSIARTVHQAREGSRFVLAMRHFLSRRDQVYVDGQLSKGDETDYLRSAWSMAWNARIAMVAHFAEPVAAEAREAGANFAIVYVPFELDVLLAERKAVAEDTNPFALPDRLGAAALSHNWQFIDTLPTFAEANPHHLRFYRINGHPNAVGHGAIARAIAHALTEDAAFCSPPGARAPEAVPPTPASDAGVRDTQIIK